MDVETTTATTTRAVAPRPRSPPKVAVHPTAVVLQVSSTVYRCMWASVLVVRWVSLLFLGAKAALYVFLAHPNLVYYASLLGPRAQPQLIPSSGCLLLLAVAHAYKAASMVFYSWSYRELVYEARVADTIDSRAVHPLHATAAPRGSQQKLRQRCSRVGVWLWGSISGARLWGALFDSHGFFSVKSEYFDIRLALREFGEIVSQTLQLYKASQLVVKHWVTNLYAGIVVVNCWSTPVVQYACRRLLSSITHGHRRVLRGLPRSLATDDLGNQIQGLVALERLLCITIDVVLDLATSIVIPTAILLPYVRVFDLVNFNFPSTILYDDVQFVSLVNELQQVLAIDAMDAIFAFFPHWGIYTGCNSIRALVVSESSRSHQRRPRKASAAVAPSPTSRVAATDRETVRGSPVVRQRPQRTSWWSRCSSHARMIDRARTFSNSNAVHVLFFVWGLTVLALHIAAVAVATRHAASQPPGCKQVLRPWLTDTTACSVLEFNCYRHQSPTVTEAAFRGLDRSSLAILIFSHCSALVVPRRIQDFPNLLGLEIYNSTIVQWDQSARFSPRSQTRLAYVVMIRTNMTHFPQALRTQLPVNLLDIEVSISNLTALPSDLDAHWHPMAVLFLEYCALTRFPSVLTRLPVADLSLVGNRITTLDIPSADWSHDISFVALSVGHNPIRELPSSPLGDLRSLRALLLEGTAIETLPDWVRAVARTAQVAVYLKHTPFCADKSASLEFGAGASVTCVDDAERGYGSVPVEFIAMDRRLVPASMMDG